MPVSILPRKKPLLWCWPPEVSEVFTPVMDELMRRRRLRTWTGGSSIGSTSMRVQGGSVERALMRGVEEPKPEFGKKKGDISHRH